MQEMKLGVFFCKKWTYPPQNETKLNQTFLLGMLDLFFILHFTYLGECVRTQRTRLFMGLQ